MEHTVEFCKLNIGVGREILHTAIICEKDETKLKREVTKVAKTIEPFKQLQAECPVIWNTYGYGSLSSFGKHWADYTPNFPLEGNAQYSITVAPTAAKFDTARKKVYNAHSKIKEAYEELTGRNYAYNPKISDIDPEIAEIIDTDLPGNVEALLGLFSCAETRLEDKIKELNNRT